MSFSVLLQLVKQNRSFGCSSTHTIRDLMRSIVMNDFIQNSFSVLRVDIETTICSK